VGNRRFKIIIELNAPTCAMAKTKMDKSVIVASVLNIVQSAGGNFMRKIRKTSVWEVAPVVTSQEKIGHSLRMTVKAAADDDKSRSIYDVIGTRSVNKKKLSKLSVPDGAAVPQSILSYMLMENLSRWSHSSTNNEEKNDQSQGDLIDSFLGSDNVKAVGPQKGEEQQFANLFDFVMSGEVHALDDCAHFLDNPDGIFTV
jgi:hypothetical protein